MLITTNKQQIKQTENIFVSPNVHELTSLQGLFHFLKTLYLCVQDLAGF